LLPIAIHVPVLGDQGRRSYCNEKGRRERSEISPLSVQKADGIGTQWNIPLSRSTERGGTKRGGIRY